MLEIPFMQLGVICTNVPAVQAEGFFGVTYLIRSWQYCFASSVHVRAGAICGTAAFCSIRFSALRSAQNSAGIFVCMEV
jgi:hypothetical protein